MSGQVLHERPILFSGEMVRAIQAKRKRATRRVMIHPPTGKFPVRFDDESREWYEDGGLWNRKCPYGTVGDRLWVRETWLIDSGKHYTYRADDPNWPGETPQWRPSIHMPRCASRITLEITNIRVERVQDITEEGGKAEGAAPCFEDLVGIVWTQPFYRWGFAKLWNSINAKRGHGWDANPWVWVIEFRRIA